MNKLQKACAKYDSIGNAHDAERQRIGGRSYDHVGRILGAFQAGREIVPTMDAKAAAWFEKLGFSVIESASIYSIFCIKGEDKN